MMTSKEIEAAIERLRVGRDDMWTADIVDALIGEDVTSGRTAKFIDALIDLLKQANPDTHMELPLDVNEVPIHVGDRLCGCGHDDEAYCQAIVNTSVIAVGNHFSRFKEWEYWNVEGIRHYEEPTVESVLAEFSEHVLRSGYHEAIDAIPEYAKKLREVMGDERHC